MKHALLEQLTPEEQCLSFLHLHQMAKNAKVSIAKITRILGFSRPKFYRDCKSVTHCVTPDLLIKLIPLFGGPTQYQHYFQQTKHDTTWHLCAWVSAADPTDFHCDIYPVLGKAAAERRFQELEQEAFDHPSYHTRLLREKESHKRIIFRISGVDLTPVLVVEFNTESPTKKNDGLSITTDPVSETVLESESATELEAEEKSFFDTNEDNL